MLVEYTASTTLKLFHRSHDFVRGVMGPLGSGKSTACAWEIFRRAHEQKPNAAKKRRTRWAVIRNTYRELTDTTLKTWEDWFGSVGRMDHQDMVYYLSLKLDDGTTVDAEILFRALDRPKDVKKLLSLDLTGAWVNEAKEVPRGVIDMLQGRVGRYPAQRDGGPTWFGVFMDTNPPDTDHWWYKLFEEDRPEGFKIFKQPSGLSPKAENIENLPPGYYARLAIGKKSEWIKVYVKGDYGFVADGKPVYPEFSDTAHVADAPLLALPGIIYVGLDFGLTPAAIFGQPDPKGRWRWMHELVTEDTGVIRFAGLLKLEMGRVFPNREFQIYGDPSGDQRQAGDAEESTVFQILETNGIPAMPAPSNDPLIRREAVVSSLTRFIDGKPGFVMSPTMKVTRKGMAGGYCYKRMQVAGEERYRDKPNKNRFSHPCEAGQYMMLGAGEGYALTAGPPKAAPSWRDRLRARRGGSSAMTA